VLSTIDPTDLIGGLDLAFGLRFAQVSVEPKVLESATDER
jgi:hypothetical protein